MTSAAALAEAHAFVSELPGAYLAEVGDGGEALSGGQRARLGVARALKRSTASAFLLDEPTSALDAKTESKVLDNLMGLAKRRGATVVLVAHSRAAVAKCDFVSVLKDGAIVETGAVSALTAKADSHLNAALDQ